MSCENKRKQGLKLLVSPGEGGDELSTRLGAKLAQRLGGEKEAPKVLELAYEARLANAGYTKSEPGDGTINAAIYALSHLAYAQDLAGAGEYSVSHASSVPFSQDLAQVRTALSERGQWSRTGGYARMPEAMAALPEVKNLAAELSKPSNWKKAHAYATLGHTFVQVLNNRELPLTVQDRIPPDQGKSKPVRKGPPVVSPAAAPPKPSPSPAPASATAPPTPTQTRTLPASYSPEAMANTYNRFHAIAEMAAINSTDAEVEVGVVKIKSVSDGESLVSIVEGTPFDVVILGWAGLFGPSRYAYLLVRDDEASRRAVEGFLKEFKPKTGGNVSLATMNAGGGEYTVIIRHR